MRPFALILRAERTATARPRPGRWPALSPWFACLAAALVSVSTGCKKLHAPAVLPVGVDQPYGHYQTQWSQWPIEAPAVGKPGEEVPTPDAATEPNDAGPSTGELPPPDALEMPDNLDDFLLPPGGEAEPTLPEPDARAPSAPDELPAAPTIPPADSAPPTPESLIPGLPPPSELPSDDETAPSLPAPDDLFRVPQPTDKPATRPTPQSDPFMDDLLEEAPADRERAADKLEEPGRGPEAAPTTPHDRSGASATQEKQPGLVATNPSEENATDARKSPPTSAPPMSVDAPVPENATAVTSPGQGESPVAASSRRKRQQPTNAASAEGPATSPTPTVPASPQPLAGATPSTGDSVAIVPTKSARLAPHGLAGKLMQPSVAKAAKSSGNSLNEPAPLPPPRGLSPLAAAKSATVRSRTAPSRDSSQTSASIAEAGQGAARSSENVEGEQASPPNADVIVNTTVAASHVTTGDSKSTPPSQWPRSTVRGPLMPAALTIAPLHIAADDRSKPVARQSAQPSDRVELASYVEEIGIPGVSLVADGVTAADCITTSFETPPPPTRAGMAVRQSPLPECCTPLYRKDVAERLIHNWHNLTFPRETLSRWADLSNSDDN